MPKSPPEQPAPTRYRKKLSSARTPSTTRPADATATAKPSRSLTARGAPASKAIAAGAVTELDEPAVKSLAPRRLPSQRRGQETVEAVLKAAGEQITESGLDKLTTKRIAAAAGLSVGAVYGYFPNKEAIVSALMSRWYEELFEAVDGVHPRFGHGLDLLSYLNNQIDRGAAVYEEQAGLGAVFDVLNAMPAVAEVTAKHDAAVIESLSTALRHYVPRAEAGEIKASSIAILAVCHEMMLVALSQDAAGKARMLKILRACVMAIGTRLVSV